jgi:hypothetical protein
LTTATPGIQTAIPADRRIDGLAEVASLSDALAPFVAAVHAYDVTDALTYVKDGKALPHYER